MVCIGMVLYALAMVCKGNENGTHWQLYALTMVCISLPLYAMHCLVIVCIDIGNGMHCLAIAWYALALG